MYSPEDVIQHIHEWSDPVVYIDTAVSRYEDGEHNAEVLLELLLDRIDPQTIYSLDLDITDDREVSNAEKLRGILTDQVSENLRETTDEKQAELHDKAQALIDKANEIDEKASEKNDRLMDHAALEEEEDEVSLGGEFSLRYPAFCVDTADLETTVTIHPASDFFIGDPDYNLEGEETEETEETEDENPYVKQFQQAKNKREAYEDVEDEKTDADQRAKERILERLKTSLKSLKQEEEQEEERIADFRRQETANLRRIFDAVEDNKRKDLER